MPVNIADPKAAHTWPWNLYPGVPLNPTENGKHLVFWDGEYVILSWFAYTSQYNPYGWYTNEKNGRPVGPAVLAGAVYHAAIPESAIEAVKRQGYREVDASGYAMNHSGLDLPPFAALSVEARVAKARSAAVSDCITEIETWQHTPTMLLRAGELKRQEIRLVKAVLNSIAATLASLK